MPRNQSGVRLTAYELEREEKIRKNREILDEMGLEGVGSLADAMRREQEAKEAAEKEKRASVAEARKKLKEAARLEAPRRSHRFNGTGAPSSEPIHDDTHKLGAAGSSSSIDVAQPPQGSAQNRSLDSVVSESQSDIASHTPIPATSHTLPALLLTPGHMSASMKQNCDHASDPIIALSPAPTCQPLGASHLANSVSSHTMIPSVAIKWYDEAENIFTRCFMPDVSDRLLLKVRELDSLTGNLKATVCTYIYRFSSHNAHNASRTRSISSARRIGRTSLGYG